MRLAERVAALTSRQDASALDVAAAAYAAAGNFDRALEVTREALALNPPPAVAAPLSGALCH